MITSEENNRLDEVDPVLIQKLNETLDSVRPYLEADGGDVVLHDVTESMIVKVKLLGECENCSLSAMTLRAGIEHAIKKAIPEVVRVEAVK